MMQREPRTHGGELTSGSSAAACLLEMPHAGDHDVSLDRSEGMQGARPAACQGVPFTIMPVSFSEVETSSVR